MSAPGCGSTQNRIHLYLFMQTMGTGRKRKEAKAVEVYYVCD